jgi:PAS domain-containing protein
MKNATGKILGLVIVVRDITERKKAEEKIKESEEKFSTLYSSMTEGVAIHKIIYDNSGIPVDYLIMDVNPAYEKITGLEIENTIGKKASKLYGTDEPPYFEIYKNVAITGIPESFETYFEPMDKHFRISVFSPGQGKFATVFDDITSRRKVEEALRESEERFRVIAASTPDHVLVQDKNLRYTMVINPQLGLSEKDMLNKTDYDFLPVEEADKLTNIKRQVFETGNPVHIEMPLTSGTGELEYFDGSYIPKFDSKGNIDGLIGYFKNMTEHKRM